MTAEPPPGRSARLVGIGPPLTGTAAAVDPPRAARPEVEHVVDRRETVRRYDESPFEEDAE